MRENPIEVAGKHNERDAIVGPGCLQLGNPLLERGDAIQQRLDAGGGGLRTWCEQRT